MAQAVAVGALLVEGRARRSGMVLLPPAAGCRGWGLGSATGVVDWGVTGVAGSVVGSFDSKQGWTWVGGPLGPLWRGRWGHVRCLPCGHFGRPHLLEAPVEVGVGHGEEVPLKVLVMAARHQLFEEMLGGVRVVAVRDEAPEGADEGVDALPRGVGGGDGSRRRLSSGSPLAGTAP